MHLIKVIALILITYIPIAIFYPAPRWTQVATNPMPAMEAACACWYPVTDSVYRFAGYNFDSVAPSNFKKVYRTKSGDTWTRLADAPWGRRHSLGCVATDADWINGEKMVIFGGNRGLVKNDLYGDIWEYDGNTWTLLIDSLPSLMERKAFLYTYAEGKIWWGMGYDETGFDKDSTLLYYDWYSYDGVTVVQEVDSMEIPGRGTTYGALPYWKGEIHIYGGASPDTIIGGSFVFLQRDDYYSYSPATGKILQRTSNSRLGKSYAAVFIWHNNMWTVGGYEYPSLNINSTDYYNWINWQRELTVPWEGRHAHNCVVINDSLVMLVGGISNTATKSDVWIMQ